MDKDKEEKFEENASGTSESAKVQETVDTANATKDENLPTDKAIETAEKENAEKIKTNELDSAKLQDLLNKIRAVFSHDAPADQPKETVDKKKKKKEGEKNTSWRMETGRARETVDKINVMVDEYEQLPTVEDIAKQEQAGNSIQENTTCMVNPVKLKELFDTVKVMAALELPVSEGDDGCKETENELKDAMIEFIDSVDEFEQRRRLEEFQRELDED